MGASINSREKGKRGEKEVARMMREHGIPARRGVQYQGTPDSPDIVHALDPLAFIEVKLTNRLSLESWYDQATVDAGHRMPVILHRRTKPRMKWRATLSLPHLLFILDIPWWDEVDRGELVEIMEALSSLSEITPRIVQTNALRFDVEFALATSEDQDTTGVPVLVHCRREPDALWMASLKASPLLDLLTEHAENNYGWPIIYGTDSYAPEIQREYEKFWDRNRKKVESNMPLYVDVD